jgi:hypothetical protein
LPIEGLGGLSVLHGTMKWPPGEVRGPRLAERGEAAMAAQALQHALGLALAEPVRVGEREHQRLDVDVGDRATIGRFAHEAQRVRSQVDLVQLGPRSGRHRGVYDLYAAVHAPGGELRGALQQCGELLAGREELARLLDHRQAISECQLGEHLAREAEGRPRPGPSGSSALA